MEELEPGDVDGSLTRVVVRVCIAGQELLELDPVDALDGAAVWGTDEEVLLRVGDPEQIPPLAAGVCVQPVEGDRKRRQVGHERAVANAAS